MSKMSRKKYSTTTVTTLTMVHGTTSTNPKPTFVSSAVSTPKRQNERMSPASAGIPDTRIYSQLAMATTTSNGSEEVVPSVSTRSRTSSGQSITFQQKRESCRSIFIRKVRLYYVLVFMMARFLCMTYGINTRSPFTVRMLERRNILIQFGRLPGIQTCPRISTFTRFLQMGES